MTGRRDPDGAIHETTTEARAASGNKMNFVVLGLGMAVIIAIFLLIFFVGAA